jgi:outer membrane immunogenic protein
MRHLSIAAIAAASTITFTQVAAAAPPPPAPVYSWTGFYIGGNVGYSWGDAHTDITGSGSTTAFLGFPNTPPGGFPASFGFADSNTARLDGVIGGGQIGYNYQLNPKWVLGIEADIQGSGERGSNTFLDTFSTPLCGALGGTGILNCFQNGTLNGTAVTTYEAKIKWFGTVRGRVGYLISDQVLFYGTGGLAYGGVDVHISSHPRRQRYRTVSLQ